jgi:hypothetical protein
MNLLVNSRIVFHETDRLQAEICIESAIVACYTGLTTIMNGSPGVSCGVVTHVNVVM